jgi:hypothetical protein
MASQASPTSSQGGTGAWLALACIAVLGGMVITKMFADRFDAGDQYPQYSSMRTDPLGTRAVLEAIDMLPGVEAVRNFDSLHKLARDEAFSLASDKDGPLHKPADAHGQALVLCGLSGGELGSISERTPHLERFVRAGGRLILALDPAGFAAKSRLERDLDRALDELDDEDRDNEQKQKDKAKGDKPKPTDDKAKDDQKEKKAEREKSLRMLSTPRSSLAHVLHVTLVPKGFELTTKGGSTLDVKPALPLAQDEVPEWFSNDYLNDDPKQDWQSEQERRLDERLKKNAAKKKGGATKDKPATPAKPEPDAEAKPVEPSPWTTLASKGDRPMIMQRSLGAGTVIVCTDRYFLSNEALWKDPKPKFLAWLIGDAKKVIFDETHFGGMIGDADGVMTLARRYRMHGLFLGGILLFALYIWRNAFSLVPSSADDDLGHWRADAVAGQSTASGLEGLLRRGVKFGELLPRCFAIWSGTRAAASAVQPQRRAQAEALLADPTALKTPVSTYQRIRDALHPSKKV